MMRSSALRRTLPPARARTIGASGRSVRDMRGRHHFSCHARSARYERASRQKRTSVALRTGALNHPNVGSARILSVIQPLNPSADLVAFLNVTGLELSADFEKRGNLNQLACEVA